MIRREIGLNLFLLLQKALEADDTSGRDGILPRRLELMPSAQLRLQTEHLHLIKLHLLHQSLADELIAYSRTWNSGNRHEVT